MEQTLPIPNEIQVLCDLLDITPAELIRAFLHDLCSIPGGNGSDERRHAKDWLLHSPLSDSTVFASDHAPAILVDFEAVYLAAYPAADNPGWEKQRAELLKELHATWRQRKEAKPATT